MASKFSHLHHRKHKFVYVLLIMTSSKPPWNFPSVLDKLISLHLQVHPKLEHSGRKPAILYILYFWSMEIGFDLFRKCS